MESRPNYESFFNTTLIVCGAMTFMFVVSIVTVSLDGDNRTCSLMRDGPAMVCRLIQKAVR